MILSELEMRNLFRKYADTWDTDDTSPAMTEDVFIKLVGKILQHNAENARCIHEYDYITTYGLTGYKCRKCGYSFNA